MRRSPSYAPAWGEALRPAGAAPGRQRRAAAGALSAMAFAAALALGSARARADQQLDPALREVVGHAIAEAQCFTDQYDSAVWYTLMEPRLRSIVKDRSERLEILKQVYCETHRTGEARLPPGLVMSLIAVESRFDRWAVSASGAVGLMQVMPFWPEKLGMRRYELVRVAANVRMGCAILRYYLGYEHNDVRKALARYNGSPGKRDYPDRVLTAWRRWNGADDLGFPATATTR